MPMNPGTSWCQNLLQADLHPSLAQVWSSPWPWGQQVKAIVFVVDHHSAKTQVKTQQSVSRAKGSQDTQLNMVFMPVSEMTNAVNSSRFVRVILIRVLASEWAPQFSTLLLCNLRCGSHCNPYWIFTFPTQVSELLSEFASFQVKKTSMNSFSSHQALNVFNIQPKSVSTLVISSVAVKTV